MQELNDDYTRTVASSTRGRDLKRELRGGDIMDDLDVMSNKLSARTKDLVEHAQQSSEASATKFDEVMARLRNTAAAHKATIRSDSSQPITGVASDEKPTET
jgi:hypothetical protein